MLVVKGSNKFQGTFIDRLGLSQEEGGGGTPDFKCQAGTIKGFLGFEMFDFGILWGRKNIQT